MLSRFSLCGGQSLARTLVKFQPASTVTTSAVSNAESIPAKKDNVSSPQTGHPPEYPPPTSKRDFVNFPRPILKDRAPPVRFGFIPDSWFQFFYPKTGYTGPYMFMFAVGTYIFSKEVFVYDHNATHLYSLILACYVIHTKFGDKISAWYDKAFENEWNRVSNAQDQEKQVLVKKIDELKKIQNLKGDIEEILKGRTESIHLQMEMHFRQRLLDVHKMVKNKLDCQAELENAERRVAQRNLVDYVIRNVMNSITPDLEKNALQMCIKDLNALAEKA